jgi:hypothetical protein
MTGRELVQALARSARSDGPAFGARARALGRLSEASRRSGWLGVHADAAFALAVGATLASVLVGRGLPLEGPGAPGFSWESSVRGGCVGGIEAPPACREDAASWETGGSSGAIGGSSGAVAGSSGSGSG